jgi:hypothetical protein
MCPVINRGLWRQEVDKDGINGLGDSYAVVIDFLAF